MKTSRLIPFIAVLLLFACYPKKPQIPMTEAPAGPLVQLLEQREQSFSSLRAIGSIQVVRKDRKRSFESTGILVNGREQLKVEAYGPLGDAVITLLWSGNEILINASGQLRAVPPKGSGLERILGADVEPADLCAILSGNVPGKITESDPKLFCAEDGPCVLEFRRKDTLVRVHTEMNRESSVLTIPFFEVYRDERQVYQVRFESHEIVSGYALPKRIIVKNPGKRMSLSVEYAEAEVNVPLDSGVFSVPGQER